MLSRQVRLSKIAHVVHLQLLTRVSRMKRAEVGQKVPSAVGWVALSAAAVLYFNTGTRRCGRARRIGIGEHKDHETPRFASERVSGGEESRGVIEQHASTETAESVGALFADCRVTSSDAAEAPPVDARVVATAPGSTALRTVIDREPAPLALQIARSQQLLSAVASGGQPETFRIYRTGPAVAFGPADQRHARYPAAVRASRREGFETAVRLAGGRPVAFHEGTVGFSWTVPDAEGRKHIRDRFEITASICRDALHSLGVDARIGPIDGEYCPGQYSVNASGVVKLVGLGQRIVRGAVHVGGVVVVSGEECVRSILSPVNQALGIDWDPRVVGSVAGVAGRPVAIDTVEGALLSALDRQVNLEVTPR